MNLIYIEFLSQVLLIQNYLIPTWLLLRKKYLHFYQGCEVRGKMSDSNLSKISDSDTESVTKR